jgi:hypothetical protein
MGSPNTKMNNAAPSGRMSRIVLDLLRITNQQRIMNLKIDNQDEINLPNWIAQTSLTLAEIGAVVFVACMQNSPATQEVFEKMGDPGMVEAMGSLKKKGVLLVSLQEKKLTLSLDIDVLRPQGLQNAGSDARRAGLRNQQ